MKLTVALPTWNNADIAWLAMEGLIRQKNSPDWELLILECASNNQAGAEFFQSYWPKLQKAGCKRMVYEYRDKRMALNEKWLRLAEIAQGEIFCLQGSDDYPHPERNAKAYEANADWYDCRYYYQYHIALEKLIEYDNKQTDANEPKEWKTGFNMAIRTELVKKIKFIKAVRSGVDFWLFENVKPKNRYVDQEKYKGVSTTGLNSISSRRYKYFLKPEHPFYETYESLTSLRIPKSVIKDLKEIKDKAIIDKQKYNTEPVLVRFTKKINGRQPGTVQNVPAHSLDYFFLRDSIELAYPVSNKQNNFELCI